MRHSTLNFDVLHNFISPVTGRVLCNTNYVLYGDKQGIATPSPIIIDIRLELIKLRNLVNAIIDGTIILPIDSLPNLPFHNIWIGNEMNRPVPTQRIDLLNLPPLFINLPNPVAVRQNFGIYNLYTGQGLLPNPLNLTEPTTTLRIDASNLPNLTEGKMWIGVINYTPPHISFSPPSVEGTLNWDPLGATPGIGASFAVPMEIGLDPGFIFVGSEDPTKLGQVVPSDALILLTDQVQVIEGDVAALESEIIGIQGEIITLQGQIEIIETALVLINTDLLAINTTLYTPVIGLVSVVAGLVITVASNTSDISTIFSTLKGGSAGQVLTSLGTASLPIWTTPTSGTVTSVTGTAGEIVVINTTTDPVVSIDPTYIGQTSITTLGIISMGTWNATSVTVPYGGTGNTNFTPYALLAGGTSSTGILQSLTTGTSGQVLTSQGSSSLPIWTTLSSEAVTSITGTANQITASASTGGVTLSMPANVIVSTSLTAGNLELITNTLQSNDTNGDIIIEPNGVGDILLITHGTGYVGIGTVTPLYLLDVGGTTRSERLLGNGNLPTVSLGSTSVVGTGASYSITGSEIGGIFSLTTGTGLLLSAGVAATFTLASAMPSSTFSVVFSPSSSNMDSIFVTSISSTQFTLNTTSASVLSTGTTYSWNFHIVGY